MFTTAVLQRGRQYILKISGTGYRDRRECWNYRDMVMDQNFVLCMTKHIILDSSVMIHSFANSDHLIMNCLGYNPFIASLSSAQHTIIIMNCKIYNYINYVYIHCTKLWKLVDPFWITCLFMFWLMIKSILSQLVSIIIVFT